ncbi:MAG: response regulator [Calothrix sp. SM1_5_4]|nr:response regulator [Calothrix sp. SM1_5_4]
MNECLHDLANLRAARGEEEALSTAQEFSPDLILIDMTMSGASGFEVCRRMRANPALAPTRMILICAGLLAEDRLKGYECGADDCIAMPLVPEELRAKVRILLRLAEAERGLRDLAGELDAKLRAQSEHLISIERAAFLGTHTAEIVHNLNNPLAILNGALALMQSRDPEDTHLRKAKAAVTRLDGLIRSILCATRQANDSPDARCRLK